LARKRHQEDQGQMTRIPATAAVLAGGRSRRMGCDKVSLPWGGVPLGPFSAARLSPWFEETLVCGDRAPGFAGGRWRIVPDLVPDRGALGGLHAALAAARCDWVFLAACDMPFVEEALVRLLWSLREGNDAVVPLSAAGETEPTCAFYARACAGPVRRAVERGGGRLVSFLPEVRVRRVQASEWTAADPAGASFRNINTPEEYRRFAPPGAGPGPS
jgi:molybdopterin-guanine dinucleotide biosynthesis protein A